MASGSATKNQKVSSRTKEPVDGLRDKSNAAADAAAEPENPAPPSERSQERTHGSPEAGGQNSPVATAAEAAAAAKRKVKEAVASSSNRGSAGGNLPPPRRAVDGHRDKSTATAAAEPESPPPPSERSQERTHGSPEAGGRNSLVSTAAEAAAAAKRKVKEAVAYSSNQGSAGGNLPPPPSAASAPRATQPSGAAKPPFPQCPMTAAKLAAASAKAVFNNLQQMKSPTVWAENVKQFIWRKTIPMARITGLYKILEMVSRHGVKFNLKSQNLGINCAYSEFRRMYGHGEFFYRSFICCNVMLGTPGGKAPPPSGPPPPRPPDDKLFCPWQDSLEDIPIYFYDISLMGNYLTMLYSVKHRQRALSPFIVGRNCIPVTPLCNPKTNLSSHFIIRLTDSQDSTYSVDCLIRDVDMYFVAFRRRLVLSPEEEEALMQEKKQQVKKHKKKKGTIGKQSKVSGWGTWYRLEDANIEMPVFLSAQHSGIPAAYGPRDQVTVGGVRAFREMLYAMATFQDNPSPSTSIQTACNRFMVTICEASRLRSVFREIMRRLRLDMDAYALSEALWFNINNWTQLGKTVLAARLIGCLDNLSYVLPEWCADHELDGHPLEKLGDLIGQHGEIMLINLDKTLIGNITREEIAQLAEQTSCRNTGPAARKDPGFDFC